jgi:hypothetical protein
MKVLLAINVKILFLNKLSCKSLQLCLLLSFRWLTNYQEIVQSLSNGRIFGICS